MVFSRALIKKSMSTFLKTAYQLSTSKGMHIAYSWNNELGFQPFTFLHCCCQEHAHCWRTFPNSASWHMESHCWIRISCEIKGQIKMTSSLFWGEKKKLFFTLLWFNLIYFHIFSKTFVKFSHLSHLSLITMHQTDEIWSIRPFSLNLLLIAYNTHSNSPFTTLCLTLFYKILGFVDESSRDEKTHFRKKIKK